MLSYSSKWNESVCTWEAIGSGTQGNVYRVTNKKTGEVSAIKQIQIETDEVYNSFFFFCCSNFFFL